MRRCLILLGLLSALLVIPALAQQTYSTSPIQTRFAALHIYVDSGTESLGAYQIELKAKPGTIKIVGVEGGDHSAFNKPPYYDPAALMNERIIIAAFSTDQKLPTGNTRVATIHLQVIGDQNPDYQLITMAAVNQAGQEININTFFDEGEVK